MNKNFISIGAALMALAVIFGAMGAHALEAVLSADQLNSFKTGVRYQAWHALALIVVQLIPTSVISTKTQRIVSILFITGIVCFSFSIYGLSTRSATGAGSWISTLGPITPVGGILLIAAWLYLVVASVRPKSVKQTL
ncbi:MAG TPA: DUF423 domain-containing protein [Cryomorphaceae bacterium]|nr:DUF423 domain-containing protein [Cryomorphaceae bacterium]